MKATEGRTRPHSVVVSPARKALESHSTRVRELHPCIALGASASASVPVESQNIVRQVHDVLRRMGDLCDQLPGGAWKGHTGKRVRNAAGIGIGGFALEPVMGYQPLRHYTQRGIESANMFELWDGVSGRYSTDSAIGLSSMPGLWHNDFLLFCLQQSTTKSNGKHVTPDGAEIKSDAVPICWGEFDSPEEQHQ